ncbi:MAG: hypothetical protein KTR25_03700 [Myxococcales bacterium]|nr:hypothetical protein [Myxococcales bacterium]
MSSNPAVPIIAEHASVLAGLLMLMVILSLILAGTERWRAAQTLRWYLVFVAVATTTCGAIVAITIWKPALGSTLLMGLTVAVIWRLTGYLPGWWAGLRLFLTRRLKVNDTIVTEHYEGQFVRAGLLRAHIVSPDGADIFLPWPQLAKPVQIRSTCAHWPVKTYIQLPRLPTREERRTLEVQAAYCPYRVWSKPVLVRPDPAQPSQLCIELWSWSPEGRDLAVDYLLRVTLVPNGGTTASERS